MSSIYTSDASIILVWIPPFTFCISSLVFAGLALRSHVRRSQQFSDRVCLSSRLITVTFLRPLFTTIIISTLVLIVSIFDLAVSLSTDGGVQPWRSWPSVHVDLSQVHVVPSGTRSDLQRVEAWWWVVPIATLVFSSTALAGLIYCAQTDSDNGRRRGPGRWFRTSLFHRSRGDDEFIQRSEGFSTRLSTNFSSRFTIPSPSPLSPGQLVSGWDDTFRSAKPKPKLPPISCTLPPASHSPSDSGSELAGSAKDASLAYLQSPASPERPAATAVLAPPRWSTLLMSPPPSLANPLSTSPAESILSSPWPRPPSTVPVSPISPIKAPQSPAAPSRRYMRPPSMGSVAGSFSSSTISANAYLPEPDMFLHAVAPAPRRVPFADAGIPTTSIPPLVERSRSPLKHMPSLESFQAEPCGGRWC